MLLAIDLESQLGDDLGFVELQIGIDFNLSIF